MQKINQYSVLSWHKACAHRSIPRYIQCKFGLGKLHSLIDEYWLFSCSGFCAGRTGKERNTDCIVDGEA